MIRRAANALMLPAGLLLASCGDSGDAGVMPAGDAGVIPPDGGSGGDSNVPDGGGGDSSIVPDTGVLDGDPPQGLSASGVVGQIADGQEVTIEWDGVNGFGDQGPNLLLYDLFDGVSGDPIPPDAALVGAWSGANDYYPPLYSDEIARSGSTAFLAWDAAEQVQRQLHIGFGNSTEFLLSYWIALPADSLFPGRDTSIGNFSSDSSWKFTWLMDGPDGHMGGGTYDQCLPTHVGRGGFYLAGNDGNWVAGLGNEWWDWYEWIRITVWARAAASAPSVNNGEGFFQTMSDNVGYRNRDLGDRPTFQGGTEQFNRLNVPGWIRSGTGGDQVRPHYDDLYFAVGPGSAARVEIGDAADYDQSNNLALAVPISWSNTEIRIRLHTNHGLASLEGAAFHIHDADNQQVGDSRVIQVNP